jgi:beta-glucanase (GH16 family)
MAFHYQTPGEDKVRKKNIWIGPDFSTDWHVFGLDWQPDVLIWYVDGVERWRYTDREYIPDRTMYILINLAVGGDWPGSPDATTPFPSFYNIDYVRVWKHQ